MHKVEKVLFPNMPEEERAEYIQDRCYSFKEDQTYTRPLADDELVVAKSEFFKKSHELSVKQRAHKKITKLHNTECKAIKTDISDRMTEIEFSQKTVVGIVFEIANYESLMMDMYDQVGYYISSRPLEAHEMQKNVFQESKDREIS